jgi:GT2 family glycosyltransferase
VGETRIQCVVVLYKNTVKESATLRSLCHCCQERGEIAKFLSVLIYDNSPQVQEFRPEDFPFPRIEYHHDPQNGGLAAAYNHALEIAHRRNIQWLLLFDQDTIVDIGLFTALLREIWAPPAEDICALVPKLIRDSEMLSPQSVGPLRNVAVSRDFVGISLKRLTALNSAACLKVQAVLQAGKFPDEYRLDYLDHIMFHRLQERGGRIMVMDVTIEHHLSLLNLATEMSMERYTNMLASEWRFIRETGARGGTLIHRLRLLKRGLQLSFASQKSGYALQTFKASLR